MGAKLIPHGGCNWEGCKVCFPDLQGKLLLTDEDHYNRALEINNGAYRRSTEYIDALAVARHASKLLKLKS